MINMIMETDYFEIKIIVKKEGTHYLFTSENLESSMIIGKEQYPQSSFESVLFN